MTRLATVVLVGVLCAAPAAMAAPDLPADTSSYPVRAHTMTVRVLGPGLRPQRPLTGRWTTAGGNGNEVLVAATRDGRLLEFGGVQPFVSNDGLHWSKVSLLTPSPLEAGEGDIVAAPQNRVFGVVWNVYAGDHVQAVTYDPQRQTWQTGEVPAHTSLFDRPWITYAKGPFTLSGSRTEFVTMLHGNTVLPGGDLLSGDGSTYLPTSPARDVAQQPVVTTRIAVVPDADADYWQPHVSAHTVPLTGGGLLLLDNPEEQLGCPVAQLDAGSGAWRCVRLPFTPVGALRQDSRGWLTMVRPEGSGFLVSVSVDGGMHWQTAHLPAPAGLRAGDTDGWDAKVNGRLGRAVIAWRLHDSKGQGQDVVWDVDVTRPQPHLRRVLLVGRGDHTTADSADATSGADRFDFSSVALLPSGQVAVSFDDSTTPQDSYGDGPSPSSGRSPAVAVIDP